MRWDAPFDVARDEHGDLTGTRFLLFDGACGFCTWSTRTLRVLDLERHVRFVPYQWLTPRDFAQLRVEPARCSREVVYAGRDGTVLGGADAVNALIAALPTARLALTLGALAMVPVLRAAEAAAYRFVAKHRVPISAFLNTAHFAVIDEDATLP